MSHNSAIISADKKIGRSIVIGDGGQEKAAFLIFRREHLAGRNMNSLLFPKGLSNAGHADAMATRCVLGLQEYTWLLA